MKIRDIVEDYQGHAFEVIADPDAANVRVQSVATKETFVIPADELTVVDGLRAR